MIAQLKYHFGNLHISQLPDEDIINLYAQLQWARKQERKFDAQLHDKELT
jgi:hypothetical protein